MPRGPVVASPVPGAVPQNPGDVIQSSVWNATVTDIYNIFNTIQPIEYGGNGVSDGKPLDNSFGIKNSTDPTKIGVFSSDNIPTATTRTYTLPATSGTLGLVSDIRGQIYGLTLSNNVTDATNDIDIAAGSSVDSTGAASMLLSSSLTKRADAVWAAGTNQGGRFYATLVNGTLHYYVIRNPTTGAVDAGLSDNATNPTGGASYPAGFTQYRRIASIPREGGVIIPFAQYGNVFRREVSQCVSLNAPGTASFLGTMTVPTGIVVEAIVAGYVLGQTSSTYIALVSPIGVPDSVPTVTTSSAVAVGPAGVAKSATISDRVTTNTSAQIRIRLGSSDATTTIVVNCQGWVDTRN